MSRLKSPSEEDIKVVGIDRDARSNVKCSSCECISVSTTDEIQVTNCQVGQSGYVEIAGIDSQVADLSTVLSDPSLKNHGFLIRDTRVKLLKGLRPGITIHRLALENNINLNFQAMRPPVLIQTLELRTKALKSFEQNAFEAGSLILSSMMPSTTKDFADEGNWTSVIRTIINLQLKGELADLLPFDVAFERINLTMKNAWSKNQELLSENFLMQAKKIQYVIFESTSQASLPENFISRSSATDISFVLDADNVRKHSLDRKDGVKSLNERNLADDQRTVLTDNTPVERCNVMCSLSDCQQTTDVMLKKNCAICLRNKIGPDEEKERKICDFKNFTPPPTTLSSTVCNHN